MQMQRRREGDSEVVVLDGRLDSTWAQHVEQALLDVIAGGQHQIILDMAAVRYVSSAGIGVLVRIYKDLHGLDGSFAMHNVADTVRQTLLMTGLKFLLDASVKLPGTTARPQSRKLAKPGYSIEVFTESAKPVEASLLDGPPLTGPKPTAAALRTLRITEERMAIGIGALDVTAEDSLSRLADFIALSGCAAVQTDYMQGTGSMVPDLHVLYAIDVRGPLTGACRFEIDNGAAPLKLSALAADLLDAAVADEIAVTIVAEAAGLVGASLRQSPAAPDSKAGNYSVPDIRDWLSFTPEPEYVRSLALISGIISKRNSSALAPQLRPMGDLQAHFHAAAFPYRPLKRSAIELREALQLCFSSGQLLGVLHLLSDTRPIAGAGETELLRGFCWMAPVQRA